MTRLVAAACAGVCLLVPAPALAAPPETTIDSGPERVVLGGRLGSAKGSLVANLRSSSQFVDADACLQLGDPKLPCTGLQIPFPFFVATHVIGRVDLGKYGTIKL
jgi:hypothetical protein